jgi:hypothetical protein
MKIDHEYLKKLLEICQASGKPTFDIECLAEAGIDYRDKQFEFHMMLLTDQGFVEQDDGDPGFGLVKGLDGFQSWAVLPLRLTASGHQFIEGLENKEVWTAIKTGFKGASLSTLKNVVPNLLEGYARKKIDALMG